MRPVAFHSEVADRERPAVPAFRRVVDLELLVPAVAPLRDSSARSLRAAHLAVGAVAARASAVVEQTQSARSYSDRDLGMFS